MSPIFNAFRCFTASLLFMCAGCTQSFGQNGSAPGGATELNEIRLRRISEAYQLGTEPTGALAILFKMLPTAIASVKDEPAGIQTVVSDFFTLGKKINDVKTTTDYQDVLSDPIAKKYGLSGAFPAWDPYLQVVSVDRVERTLEEQISGTSSAIKQIVSFQKPGADKALNGAIAQLKASLATRARQTHN